MLRLEPDKLLKRCNEFRKAGGAEPITELTPGVPRNRKRCLIASNLNFDCAVGYTFSNAGVIASQDKRFKDVAKQLGLKPLWHLTANEWKGWDVFELPEDLLASAQAFDKSEYPEELYLAS